MKTNENTNRILTLMGLSLLAMASEGNPGQYDDAVRLAMMKATGIEQTPEKAGTNSSAPSPSDYCFGVRQLADYLGVSAPTAQKYINEGKLDPAMRRVGRKYSFLKAKVDEIFAANKDA
jgi:excisionase family DNA binding protein